MNTTKILHKMCQKELSGADIKAIAKARGFSDKQVTPGLLETFLLSDVGLENVFDSLESEETLMLHLLKLKNRTQDISFFERISTKTIARYGTFNQKYGDLFKQVKMTLIRKGILFFALEPVIAERKTKLERMAFCFPSRFHEFLPSPLPSAISLAGAGETTETALRNKLVEIGRHKVCDPNDKKTPFILNLQQGRLRSGTRPFKAEHLSQWQKFAWSDAFLPMLSYTPDANHFVAPLDALMYAFDQLKTDQWATPQELTPLLKLFCRPEKLPEAEKICAKGWQTGCLARQKKGSQHYYRPASSLIEIPATYQPDNDMRVLADGRVAINLQTVPYKYLESLARIAKVKANRHILTLEPDPVRLGRVVKEMRDEPLKRWLLKNSPLFAKTIRQMEKRWAKQIVHRNIDVAQVKDLSLTVALKKAFEKSGKVVFMPDGFIAFAPGMRTAIEAQVIKSGFAVKTVKAK